MGLGTLPRSGMGRSLAWPEAYIDRVRREKKVLILADSQASIAAVGKAGRTGKARSQHLRNAVNMIAEIKEEGGESNWGG